MSSEWASLPRGYNHRYPILRIRHRGLPTPKGMTEEDDGVVFRLREWVKSSEAKEAGKKGFRMRLIFDLLLFSIMAIIAITIGL